MLRHVGMTRGQAARCSPAKDCSPASSACWRSEPGLVDQPGADSRGQPSVVPLEHGAARAMVALSASPLMLALATLTARSARMLSEDVVPCATTVNGHRYTRRRSHHRNAIMRALRLIMLCLFTCWLFQSHAPVLRKPSRSRGAVMEWVEPTTAAMPRASPRCMRCRRCSGARACRHRHRAAADPAVSSSRRAIPTCVRVDDRHVRLAGHGGALVAGTYTVTDLRDGREVATPARFTFVLEQRGGKWVILHHHSSRMPAQ